MPYWRADFEPGNAMTRLMALLAFMFVLSACGAQAPCDDSDPVGACATSHSQTHGMM
jgi:hypothetical protein